MNLKAAASAAAMMSSSSPSSTSIIVGLNAALQKRFVLPSGKSLIPGDVHRAAILQTGLGGKGQDVAVTLSCLEFGNADNLQLAQFVGVGGAGDTVHDLVKEAIGPDALECTVRTEASMRTCTSIVAFDATTELVEPSGKVSETEHAELIERLKKQQAVNALCIMGSMPPGCPEDSYAQIYQTVADKTGKEEATSTPLLCLIDSVIGLDPLFETITKQSADSSSKSIYKTILKINASELCRLVNVDKASSESGGVAIDEVVKAVQAFWKHYQQPAVTALAITGGAHPAYLVTFDDKKPDDETTVQIHRLPVPKLSTKDQTLYPIGAGDSVAAGMLAAWKSLELPDTPLLPEPLDNLLKSSNDDDNNTTPTTLLKSLAFGLACGSASCLQQENSVVDLADVERFVKELQGAHDFVGQFDLTSKKEVVES